MLLKYSSAIMAESCYLYNFEFRTLKFCLIPCSGNEFRSACRMWAPPSLHFILVNEWPPLRTIAVASMLPGKRLKNGNEKCRPYE